MFGLDAKQAQNSLRTVSSAHGETGMRARADSSREMTKQAQGAASAEGSVHHRRRDWPRNASPALAPARPSRRQVRSGQQLCLFFTSNYRQIQEIIDMGVSSTVEYEKTQPEGTRGCNRLEVGKHALFTSNPRLMI